jgi:Tol biopolymer transport system component
VIVNSCLPHGFEGYLTGNAQQQDGHWWWFIAGAGWVAEDYLAYVSYVDIRARTVPELAGRGMIAFTRQHPTFGSSIWVMNADGSGQRMLRPPTENEYPSSLTWSPDGRSLAFTVQRVSVTGGGWEVHVVGVDDRAAETVFENAFGTSWSPDGATFATVVDPVVEGVGGGVRGVPAIINAATGERLMLAAQPFSQQSAPSFNHDGTKLLLTYADYAEGSSDPGPRIIVWDLAGNELARIEPPADTYYASPGWSPVDDRILFHVGSNTQGQPQYVVYDLTRHDIVGGARVPKASDKIGGRCGSWNMWSATWSRDGSRVLYSFDMGDTGANGIWTWDLATGQQALVPAISTSPASAGPNGYGAFSSAGYDDNFIFIASPNGGFPLLVTDGTGPVWSP